jgi:hypothetical protein
MRISIGALVIAASTWMALSVAAEDNLLSRGDVQSVVVYSVILDSLTRGALNRDDVVGRPDFVLEIRERGSAVRFLQLLVRAPLTKYEPGRNPLNARVALDVRYSSGSVDRYVGDATFLYSQDQNTRSAFNPSALDRIDPSAWLRSRDQDPPRTP